MQFGRYEIIKEVGRGSMGIVYEARDPSIDRIVALKVLRQDRITSESFVKRFMKEARAIGRLCHTNIVTVYDVGEDHDNVFIAMEFLQGESLADIIRTRHGNPRDVVEIGRQIAGALECAHSKGVIHRDIKPSNIVVLSDGQVKITDFGIAHIDDTTATLQTQAGDIMGTPAYMSPEQAKGSQVDHRTDIFSTGIILYELSTGTRPFGGEGKTLMTVLNEIVELVPHEPSAASPNISKALSKVIMKALEKDPANRHQSGRELADALTASLTAEQEPSAPAVPPPVKQKEKGRRLWPAIALGVTAFLAVAMLTVIQRKEPAPTPAAPPRTAPPPARTLPAPPKQAERPVAPVQPAPPAMPPVVPAKPAAPPAPDKTISPPARPAPPVAAQRLAPAAPKALPLPRFAFLKIRTIPAGATVYVDGTEKGTTPCTIKLPLGICKVRLTTPGFKDVERQIKLQKMTEYRITEALKPGR